MEISDHGYWVGYDRKEHKFDLLLAQSISTIASNAYCYNIMDVGCGEGKYMDFFRKNGFVCCGFDGNPETESITKGKCSTIDFATPVKISPVDLVVSLEVGEHIPEEFEDVFINNLVDHAEKLIILSWGIPGQGGFGHVNCKANDYIIDKIQGLGPMYHYEDSQYLRDNSTRSWFKNTLMVFYK
jgi:hypothetical protein